MGAKALIWQWVQHVQGKARSSVAGAEWTRQSTEDQACVGPVWFLLEVRSETCGEF